GEQWAFGFDEKRFVGMAQPIRRNKQAGSQQTIKQDHTQRDELDRVFSQRQQTPLCPRTYHFVRDSDYSTDFTRRDCHDFSSLGDLGSGSAGVILRKAGTKNQKKKANIKR